MGRLYLIRHGETEWNKVQRMQGCSYDIGLSDDGRRQAKSLAERLRNEKIDMIFSSTLSRAFETASIIASYHNLEVETSEAFKEINFGKWEGMYYTELMAEYSELMQIWKATPHLAVVPEAETIAQLQQRSVAKLNQLFEMYPEKDIAIVSHGITNKLMILQLMGMQLSQLHRIRQDNTSLSIFEYHDGKFDMITLNDICHLEGIFDKTKGSFEMK